MKSKSVFNKSLKAMIVSSALFLNFIMIPSASANYTTTLSVNSVNVVGATNSATPATVPLPTDNLIDATDAVRVSITGLAAGSTVSVTASNSFLVGALSSNLNTVRSTDGVASANINVGTGTSAEIFVFTKTTSLGSFTVSSGGTTNTYYIKGSSSGPAYNLDVNIGTNNYTSSVANLPIKVTDVFGNPVSGVIPLISAIGLTASTPAATDASGVTQTTLTYPTVAGRGALQISISTTPVVGLAQPKNIYSTFIDIVSLADLLAAEKAARAQDKVASEAALAAEKKISADALAAKAASEKLLSDTRTALENQISQLNKSSQELNSQITTLKNSVNLLTTRYNSLVKKYNALAKKYKQPTIKG